MQPTHDHVTVPDGMVVLDDDAIVRVAAITSIMRDGDGGVVVRLGAATIRIDCTIEELLRRIDAQIPRKF